MKPHNIGIALSGGGIRATIFHLGLFKWLAEHEMLEEIKSISSVSGASLCIGMIYSYNNLKWPTSKEFLTTVLPSVEKVLLSNDLQLSALSRLIISPFYWNKKVNIISKSLEKKWGVHGKLTDIIGDVKWYINCTTYETGKRFYFCHEKMGDYKIGYVEKPNIPLSDVMAASAGFPILIGPYSLQTDDYHWVPGEYSTLNWQPPHRTIHLWDGGVYDNLGLESIYKFDNGGFLKDGIEFMIISNASASIDFHHRQYIRADRNLKRILDIAMDQVTALRSRNVMDFIKRTNKGMYIKIGNSAEKIALDSKCPENVKNSLVERCLSNEQVNNAMHYKTTLRKPNTSNYNDYFWPHNIARHVLIDKDIGHAKVKALESFALSIQTDSDIIAINEDIFSKKESILNALTSADILLDMSASIAVERYLALDIESKARQLSCFLNPKGTATILLLKSVDGTDRLDLLEMQYYREIVSNEKYLDHMILPEEMTYSGSCRSISSRISQDNVSLSAALCSKALKIHILDKRGKIIIWTHKDDSVNRDIFLADSWIAYQTGKWMIEISEKLLRDIKNERLQSIPQETGGVLIGAYDLTRKRVYIVCEVKAPEDSISSPNSFIRGCMNLPEQLETIRQRTLGNLSYIGEWHSHINDDTQKSLDDKKLHDAIIDYNRNNCLPGCMMIVGENGFSIYIGE